MKTHNIKQKDATVTARVYSSDLDTLKKYNINISELICAHIKKCAETLRRNNEKK